MTYYENNKLCKYHENHWSINLVTPNHPKMASQCNWHRCSQGAVMPLGAEMGDLRDAWLHRLEQITIPM